ncbi:hypothetical protein [Ornithinimicrobium pekingense]|nr:hypothetical protein [Ornithinimicrobium pekingense]
MSEQQRDDQHDPSADSGGGTVSEGGSGGLNADTALGGADSVPDTPDVNTEVSDAVDINESSQEGESPAQDGDVPD